METVIIITAGVLVTIAVYLLLSKKIIQVIVGTAVLTHAVHLLLMTMGGFGGDLPLINDQSKSYVDAIPQALILTSIVISFAVTAFFLVLSYTAYQKLYTDDLAKMRGVYYE